MAGKGTNTKRIWAASGLAAVVGVLTGYALFHGSDDGSNAAKGDSVPFAGSSTGSKPTHTVPNDWVEPERRAALPQGEHTDRYGSHIRFPHTAQGAEAMLAASCTVVVEGSTDTADERLRIYYSYSARDVRTKDNAEKVELAAIQSDKELHRKFGVAPGSDLPPGAYFRNTVIGFKVIKASDDEVSLWLLSRVTQKAGETAKEEVTYTRDLVGAHWEDGDWKLSLSVTSSAIQEAQGKAKPQMAAPGDEGFNKAGWTAIREAS